MYVLKLRIWRKGDSLKENKKMHSDVYDDKSPEVLRIELFLSGEPLLE